MTKDQWYDKLTAKPITINNFIYRFAKPETYSNLADLEIDDKDGYRVMLSDYIIEENESTKELSIRITYYTERPSSKITVKEDTINPEYFHQYMILSQHDFEQAVTSGLLWVEVSLSKT